MEPCGVPLRGLFAVYEPLLNLEASIASYIIYRIGIYHRGPLWGSEDAEGCFGYSTLYGMVCCSGVFYALWGKLLPIMLGWDSIVYLYRIFLGDYLLRWLVVANALLWWNGINW